MPVQGVGRVVWLVNLCPPVGEPYSRAGVSRGSVAGAVLAAEAAPRGSLRPALSGRAASPGGQREGPENAWENKACLACPGG